MERGTNLVVLVLVVSTLFYGVSAQRVCRTFVTDDELLVDQQLLNNIEVQEITFQRVVDCLTDGGILTFNESLEVPTLQIETPIRIQGSAGEATSSLTCRDGPIFLVSATGVQLSNLEIRDCVLDSEDAPVVLLAGSSVEINSVDFTNNTNEAGSATLQMESNSELVVDDCHFNGNNGGWGTIHVIDGNNLNVSSSTFVNNSVYLGGGALQIESEQRRTTVFIEDGSLFENNEAIDGEGGAILATGNVRLTIREDTIFRRNKAANQGGALFVRGSSSLSIEDAFFIENESDFLGGGAIHAENATNADLDISISNTIFSKNAAKNQLGSGGAIRLQGPTVTCTIERGVSFISNVAELDGGGIHVSEGPTVTIQATSFTGNEVNQGGGAALFALSSLYTGSNIKRMRLRIESSTFVHNRAVAGRRGGGTLGFASLGTEVLIERCRFDENESLFGSGGVIYLYDGPFLTVTNSSFKDNKAIWGGVMFGEKQARYNITECVFHRNQAEEGGVARTRGAIDVDIVNSDIRNNSAIEDGGAIRAENHIYGDRDRARFWFENNNVVNNLAGYELRQAGFGTRITRGGGIAVIGTGQYVHIVNSTFRNNSASEGGAIAAIGPRQLLITDHSRFEDNLANFGGAIFIFVDNQIDIWGDFYRISNATFVDNNANSDGGAIRISSSTSANNLIPYNALSRTVHFQDCVIRRNRALSNGGGLMVTGVGLELQNVEFINNTVFTDVRTAASGHGGGIAAIDGASISITGSSIRGNVAHVSGGGLFVMDSSVAVFESNFTRNRAINENGNGGAVALMLESNRLIPRLESSYYRRPVLFRCNDCRFVKNNASVHGGAIYHHHSDPTANYSEIWNCTDQNVTSFEQFRTTQDFNLNCVWRVQTIELLQYRHIRLARVEFIRNEAQSGAGIFTNHPDTINITTGSLDILGVPIRQAVNNSTFLKEAGISFENNTLSANGYGPNYASPPAIPLITNLTDGVSYESRRQFRSGGSLEFAIQFCDSFDQNVSFVRNFTAEIQINGNHSENGIALLTGQLTDRLRENGTMVFSGTRLRGKKNTNYSISIQFFLEGEQLKTVQPASIPVFIRSCRIGEETVPQSPDIIECRPCGEGQFNSNPSNKTCQACDKIEGVQCLGAVAIPETHYWHPSSASGRAKRCIGHESCDFEERFKRIRMKEEQAHLNGSNVSYRDGYKNSEIQCAKGYRGIMCGTCAQDYGREGDVCRRCAARGVRYFVVVTLIFWSIVFVAAFIRSVLQLSERIEFNKKFRGVSNPLAQAVPTEAIPGLSVIQGSTSDGEIQPDVEQLALQLQPSLEETNTYPVPKSLLKRISAPKSPRSTSGSHSNQSAGQNQGTNLTQAAISKKRRTRLASRLQQIKHNPSMKNMDPLTLANPVSEVLKVLINFLQVTSLAVSINVDWTRAMRRTLSGLGAASSLATGAGYSSLDCFMTSGTVPKSLRRMTIMLLYPFFLFLIFAVFWTLYTIIKGRSSDYFKRRIWLVVLSLNYFFYIGMTRNLLRFFACVKIDEEDVPDTESSLDGYYWEEDTSVECYSRRHALLVGLLVVPLLCAVTIGFPVGTLSILLANSHRLDNEEFVKTYGFLYRAYDIYYWEILVILRKGLIAAIAVFDYGLGENIQGLLCVMVLGASLSLHLMFVPFTKEMPKLNHLETCSLSATILVFLSGLIFNDSKTSSDTKVFLSVVAILFVAGTLLMILFELFSSSEEAIDMLLLEHQIMDWDELLENRLSLKVERLILHFTTDALIARRNKKMVKRSHHQQLAALPTTSAYTPATSGTNL